MKVFKVRCKSHRTTLDIVFSKEHKDKLLSLRMNVVADNLEDAKSKTETFLQSNPKYQDLNVVEFKELKGIVILNP